MPTNGIEIMSMLFVWYIVPPQERSHRLVYNPLAFTHHAKENPNQTAIHINHKIMITNILNRFLNIPISEFASLPSSGLWSYSPSLLFKSFNWKPTKWVQPSCLVKARNASATRTPASISPLTSQRSCVEAFWWEAVRCCSLAPHKQFLCSATCKWQPISYLSVCSMT